MWWKNTEKLKLMEKQVGEFRKCLIQQREEINRLKLLCKHENGYIITEVNTNEFSRRCAVCDKELDYTDSYDTLLYWRAELNMIQAEKDLRTAEDLLADARKKYENHLAKHWQILAILVKWVQFFENLARGEIKIPIQSFGEISSHF